MQSKATIRFSAIGLDHPHIYGQVGLLLRAGAELVSFYAIDPAHIAQFNQAFDHPPLASSKAEILEDENIQMVISAGIPCERAPLGIEVMRSGKDYMSDKPGFTSLAQLAEVRKVQAETGQIYSICFSERLESRATVMAGKLVAQGAIGEVVQTIGTGPHRIGWTQRPDWFFVKEKYGGILCDIGAHQVDQFLFFTGSTAGEVVASQVANYKFPQFPELEDFGEMMLRGNGGTGYVRLDWYTPDGLGVWGDGRLTILGTEGYIELRKYIDVAGRSGADHLFLVNGDATQYVDCKHVELPYGRQLIADVLDRTETAMPQAHTFLASELALKAEAGAARLGNLQVEE